MWVFWWSVHSATPSDDDSDPLTIARKPKTEINKPLKQDLKKNHRSKNFTLNLVVQLSMNIQLKIASCQQSSLECKLYAVSAQK